jgi:uncharacterized alkaline shock family protein YloU
MKMAATKTSKKTIRKTTSRKSTGIKKSTTVKTVGKKSRTKKTASGTRAKSSNTKITATRPDVPGLPEQDNCLVGNMLNTETTPGIIPKLPIEPGPRTDISIDRIASGISSTDTDFGKGPELDTGTTSQETPVTAILPDGGFDISRKVLARIASLAANEIDGLLPPRNDAIIKLIDSMHGRTDGIKVNVGSTEAAVDMHIRVQYGTHIPDVTERLRENITRRIHQMTGLKVTEINIRVRDVTTADDPQPEKTAGDRHATAL